MPPLERFDLAGVVTYWQKTGDDAYSRPTLARGVAVRARVVYGRRDVTDPTGNVISLDGELAVDRELVEGSLVWDGPPESLPADLVPTADVLQVTFVTAVPDVKGRCTRYEAGFVRYRESFPSDSVVR